MVKRTKTDYHRLFSYSISLDEFNEKVKRIIEDTHEPIHRIELQLEEEWDYSDKSTILNLEITRDQTEAEEALEDLKIQKNIDREKERELALLKQLQEKYSGN